MDIQLFLDAGRTLDASLNVSQKSDDGGEHLGYYCVL